MSKNNQHPNVPVVLGQPQPEVISQPPVVEEVLPASALQAAKEYANASIVLRSARQTRGELQERIIEIDRVIAKAEAATNKAREALLKVIEEGLHQTSR